MTGRKRNSTMPTSIAVVIPTLDEERVLSRTLLTLRQLRFDEVVLVDGGSHGERPVLASSFGMTSRFGRVVGNPLPSSNKIAVSAHFADNVRCKLLSWLMACVIA